MLLELRIENFAIIENLELEFSPGLTTFTGETGAGKSIIIDAVETILGGRADSLQVRAGAERASIEAVFKIPEKSHSEITAILEREDLLDDQSSLSLGREIRLTGRNIARINGRSVSVALLKELGEYLVDLHGQSEHLSLLQVNRHLGLLDRYAATDAQLHLEASLEAYQQAYQRIQQVQRELKRIREAEQDAARRSDMLSYQINEIDSAHLKTGEEESMREERNRLANAENLASLSQEALLILDESGPETAPVSELFGQVVQALSHLARVDPSQAYLSDSAQVLSENLADLAINLRTYLESIEFNPRRLDFLEDRLALLHNLKRKYGESISAILTYAEQARRQLDEISHASERLEELEVEKTDLLSQIGQVGQALSQKRHAAAKQLAQAIETELNDLSMSGARFRVDFQQHPDPEGAPISDGSRLAYYPTGLERVEFLIAPNPGEGFKPLAKIASGGETSRLMLALKNVLAQADHVPTLIFDEIDQGIGGRVGTVVGQKLAQLGRQHQVLCITHLPQLAAFGRQHLHVEKHVQAGRTSTRVRKLEQQARLFELANMMGSSGEGALQSAQELLQIAQNQ
jgi:DNA repair protein RecN (Recombination protein N)